MRQRRAFVDLKVNPKASRDALLGWYGDALKVAVTAAPERGRANAAVAALLAAAVGVPVSCVEVVAGLSSSRKRVAISGLDQAELTRRLAAAVGPG